MSSSRAQSWIPLGRSAARGTILPRVAVDPTGSTWLTFQDLGSRDHRGSTMILYPDASNSDDPWKMVGPRGSGSVADDWWPNLAFGPLGEVYRASYDYRLYAPTFAYPLLNVRRYNPWLYDWELLMPFPYSFGEAHCPDIEVDHTGRPLVMYRDGNSATEQWPHGAATVIRFEPFPGGLYSPVFLGGQGFSKGMFEPIVRPNSATWFNSLEIAPDGRIWAAWREDSSIFGSLAVVATYLERQDRWLAVGPPGLTQPINHGDNLSLALDGKGVPHVATFDGCSFQVLRLEDGIKAGHWVSLGEGIAREDEPRMTPGTEYREWTAFAISPNGVLHLAYRAKAHGNRVVVRRRIGGVWKTVGQPAFTEPSGEDDQMSLAFHGEAPVVSFRHSTPKTTLPSSQELQVWTFR